MQLSTNPSLSDSHFTSWFSTMHVWVSNSSQRLEVFALWVFTETMWDGFMRDRLSFKKERMENHAFCYATLVGRSGRGEE